MKKNNKIIGRIEECRRLDSCLKADTAQLIIVYGRSLSMKVNKYPTMDDLVSLITRIANNQDKMMEIMTMDPEDARSVLNAWYGKMVMDEVRKKFWTATTHPD